MDKREFISFSNADKRSFVTVLNDLVPVLDHMPQDQRVKLIQCFPDLIGNIVAMIPSGEEYAEFKEKLESLWSSAHSGGWEVDYQDRSFKAAMRMFMGFLEELESADDGNVMRFFWKHFPEVFLKIHDEVLANETLKRMFRTKYQEYVDFRQWSGKYWEQATTSEARAATIDTITESPITTDGKQVLFHWRTISSRVTQSDLYIWTYYTAKFNSIKTLKRNEKQEFQLPWISNPNLVNVKVYLFEWDNNQDILYIHHPEQRIIVDFDSPLKVYADKRVSGSPMIINAWSINIDEESWYTAWRNVNVVSWDTIDTKWDFQVWSRSGAPGSSWRGSEPQFWPSFPFWDKKPTGEKNRVSGSTIISGWTVSIWDITINWGKVDTMDQDDVSYIQLRLKKYITGSRTEQQLLEDIEDQVKDAWWIEATIVKFWEDTCLVVETAKWYIVIWRDVRGSTLDKIKSKYDVSGKSLMTYFKNISNG